ncbi:MAG: cell division protein SepF [Firmicutes bacterium]|nr:cell division protein SepF [Bacillota bacterium]
MKSFNDWLRQKRGNGAASRQEDEPKHPPFYEDTHDEHGNYIGEKQATPSFNQPYQYNQTSHINQTETSQKYGNIAVYRLKSLKDIEKFITFLRGGEPAVANLNDIDENDAQRILDYLSGAIFALSGSVHRITENIFVFSPKGTQIHS